MIRNFFYFLSVIIGTINGGLSAVLLEKYFKNQISLLCGDWLPVLFLMGTINSLYAPLKLLWWTLWNGKYEKTNKNQFENIGFFSYHVFLCVFYIYYWIDSPKTEECKKLLSLWRLQATMGLHVIFYFFNLCINLIDIINNDRLLSYENKE